MHAIKMLKQAKKLAHEQVEKASPLEKALYDRVKDLPEDEAIERIAARMLKLAWAKLDI